MNEVSLMWKHAEEENRFADALAGAEIHWFFIQGIKALRAGLYVPAVSSLLNGIEASIRVTTAQLNSDSGELLELPKYRVLSNNLINNGKDLGMPVNLLAFPGEDDFMSKLDSQKPNVVNVELVRHRNNICHGNIFEFINRELGSGNYFFTPECLREFSDELLQVSFQWADGLGEFRKLHDLNNQ